jgi:predicted nucleic acid-binding protein
MDVVLDTSALVAVLVDAPEKEALVALTPGASILAPSSVHWEIGNAFSAMLRRRRLTMKQVQAALSSYEQIPIRYVDVDLQKALELAGRLGVYAYDAYVLACAESMRSPLITLDGGMIAAGKKMGLTILEVNR